MKISIAITTDIEASKKSSLVYRLSENLRKEFYNLNYGNDLQEILIGFKCTFPPEGFEKFEKIEKPFYVDYKEINNVHTGEKMVLNKYFYYQFKIERNDYKDFVNGDDFESMKILISNLIASLENFNKLPKKVKKFEVNNFKSDLEDFLIKFLYEEKICNFPI